MGLPVEVNNLMMGSLGGYTIGRSLRFRSSASAYLNRTPASASNRTTWTWSAWVKKAATTQQGIFSSQSPSSSADYDSLEFYQDTIRWYFNGTLGSFLRTTAVYRDPSAWYHIVASVDTTQATASNRMKLYINGVQVTAFTNETYPSQNYNTFANNTYKQAIGAFASATSSSFFDGYLAEVNFIDGQALTPSSFGAYDTNGVWQPKKYTGTYGTNGFYLPFSSGFNTTQTYAGSFNGSSQFLSVASSASLSAGTGDFTVEANIYFNALPSASGFQGIFENQIATTAATSDKFWCGLYNSAGTYQLGIGQHNTANRAYAVWTPTVGTWYHVALVRQSGTTLVFVNGVQQTVTNSTVLNGANFSQNGASFGAASNTGAPAYFNGYISNARYIVGSAVYTTGFTPPSANLTAVTNTQWLTLQNSTIIDNSTAARTITNNGSLPVSLQYPFQYTLASVGSDYSGNSNNWTLNNINYTILGTTYDSMIDSPTNAVGTSTGIGNYAVLNPLYIQGATAVLSDGNLQSTTGTTGTKTKPSTIAVSSGQWYWEVTPTAGSGGADYHIGIANADFTTTAVLGSTSTEYSYAHTAVKRNNNTSTAYGATYTTNDIIGVALDLDGGTLTYYKNGVSQGQAFSGISGTYVAIAGDGSTAQTSTFVFNFGQRPFSYTPPSGFKALNTYNLPAPSIANGAQYMAATTYTGNGGTQSIVNSGGFQPDFVWIKDRSAVSSHQLFDSIRGAGTRLYSNLTNGEDTNINSLSSFNSNGFSLGNVSGTNASGDSFIGWQWKAGGTGVTNNSGTITSTVSANPSAGFSIVTYTGNGVNGATVGHGLGVTPSMFIIKSRSLGTEGWNTYHTSIGNTAYVKLDVTQASTTDSTRWNNTSPTSSVFTISTNTAVNGNGSTYVAYCFSAVSGYSAFGKYTGNGSTDGPFVYTGFRPRFVLVKDSSAAQNWRLFDSSRSTYNAVLEGLFPNLSNAESAAETGPDFLSNGFKIRTSSATHNASGNTIIYAAFAENPFNYSRAR
jgi:hypothetical protein